MSNERKHTVSELQAILYHMNYYKLESGFIGLHTKGAQPAFYTEKPKTFEMFRWEPVTRKDVLRMIDEAELPTPSNENKKLKRLLHDLTPGGSEFANDPEKCFKWVKETWFNESKHLKEVIKELRGKNGELTEENKSLKEANERLMDALNPFVKLADAVLKDTLKTNESPLYGYNDVVLYVRDLSAAKQAIGA